MSEQALPGRHAAVAVRQRSRRLPTGWGVWLLVLATTGLHLALAVRNVVRGGAYLVPAVADLRGADPYDWVEAYLRLFFKPASSVDAGRVLALWMLVLLVTAVYASLRAGGRLPHGVLSFVGHALSIMVILAVATPAVWYLFGTWGPTAAEFVAPLTFALVSVLMLREMDAE